MTDVFFGILGPVCVRVDGRVSVLNGKPGVVLAALLLNANTTVSKDRLVGALWEHPPSSAVSNLQTYVAGLRKVLPGARLLTKGTGYLLQAGAREVDHLTFTAETRAARLEIEAGRTDAALARFDQALALWRGPLAEGVLLRGDLLTHALDLESGRTQARLDRARAQLDLGSHQDAVDQLQRLVSEQPLLEQAWHLLMLAFARAGERNKALETYRRARDTLVAELGVEPGTDLRRLQATVLADSRLPSHDDGAGRAGVCLLPPDIADFVGRRAELSTTVETLRRGRGPTPPICAISGQGGVGKTTMAIHVAHRVRQYFPDGQLYITLHGGEKHPTDPNEALGRFLRALGVDSAAVPTGLDQRAEIYRDKLANRRYLVVLDDAADENQLHPLLPGTPGCAVLVTSRHRLTTLPGARLTDLPVLSSAEALDLIRHLIGPDRAGAAAGDVDQLVQLCGGLPLAVRIAGAKLAARPHWSPAQLVTRMSDTRRGLGQLSHGAQAVRASLAVSYHGLTDPARRLFRLLGMVAAPDFGAWAAAVLCDITLPDAEDLMDELVDVRLLDVASHDPSGQPRFHFHDLTRAYARERVEDEETEHERTAALLRFLSAWLTLTRDAHVRLCGGMYGLPRGRGPRTSFAPELTERHAPRDPLAWVETERAGIVAAVHQCAEPGADELCWELASAAMHLFETGSFHDEWRTTHETALRVARASGDVRGQATMLNGLARLHLAHDDLSGCDEVLAEALDLFDKADDPHGRALAQVNMAQLHRLRGGYAQALACYEQAADGLAQAEDRGTEITVLRGIGRIHFILGQLDLAGSFMTRAMRLADAIGDDRSREFTRVVLGEIELAQGDSAAAADCFVQARDRLEELGFRRGTAYALLGLASARVTQQDFPEAERLLHEALTIYQDVGENLGHARVLSVQAELQRQRRQFTAAVTTLTKAIEICQAIHMPRRHGLALIALGHVYRDLDDLPAALDAWQRSLTILRPTSAPEATQVATLIEQVTKPTN